MNCAGTRLLAVLLLVLLAAPTHAVQLYHLTPLGTLPGVDTGASFATGINNNGQVVGSFGDDAFVWTSATGMKALPRPDNSSFAGAQGINNSGQVIGFSYDGSNYQAISWNGGNPQNLGALPNHKTSYAMAISDSGQIVGQSSLTASSNFHAYRRTSADGIQALAEQDQATGSSAAGVNFSGQVVGSSFDDTHARAVLWSSTGVIQDLGSLGGAINQANAINNGGQVVGQSYVGQVPHAFLWTSAAGMQDLSSSGVFVSSASSINNHGQIVGSVTVSGGQRAALWTAGISGFLDLNQVLDASGNGWTLSSAQGINDLGQVIVQGSQSGSDTESVVLTPIPSLGDMNGDGTVNPADRTPFELALTYQRSYAEVYPTLLAFQQAGDINHDGAFDNFDIPPFEQLVPGVSTGLVPEPSSAALGLAALAALALCAARRAHSRNYPRGS